MNTSVYPSQQDKVISGASAFGMHLLFIALLIFGVNWQKNIEPQANIVDLWKDLPSQSRPQVEPPPVPPPPKPVEMPKVEPPPPKAVAKPEVVKPDIAMKEKAEKEKAEKEKAEKQRRLLEDQKKDAKKRDDEKQRQAKEAADAQRLAKEQEDIQRKLAEQAAAAQSKLIADYTSRIQARIYQMMQPFDDLPKDTYVDVEITVLPDGNVLATVVKKNSSNAKFNAAVERAILKAQPLPVPKDATLFSTNFRRIDLTFRPKQ